MKPGGLQWRRGESRLCIIIRLVAVTIFIVIHPGTSLPRDFTRLRLDTRKLSQQYLDRNLWQAHNDAYNRVSDVTWPLATYTPSRLAK
jgi:hypothetical protein